MALLHSKCMAQGVCSMHLSGGYVDLISPPLYTIGMYGTRHGVYDDHDRWTLFSGILVGYDWDSKPGLF